MQSQNQRNEEMTHVNNPNMTIRSTDINQIRKQQVISPSYAMSSCDFLPVVLVIDSLKSGPIMVQFFVQGVSSLLLAG